MPRIIIICHVDDEHVGTDTAEYGRRLDGELMRIQNNTEVGLQVSQVLIDGDNLYAKPLT